MTQFQKTEALNELLFKQGSSLRLGSRTVFIPMTHELIMHAFCMYPGRYALYTNTFRLIFHYIHSAILKKPSSKQNEACFV